MKLLVSSLVIFIFINNVLTVPVVKQPEETRCLIPKPILDAIHKGLSDISKSNDIIEISGLDKIDTQCKQDVGKIVSTLEKLAEDYKELSSAKISDDDMEKLKQNFFDMVNQLTKQKDVFSRENEKSSIQETGILQENVHNLRLKIVGLQEEIQEKVETYWLNIFELISITHDGKNANRKNYLAEISNNRLREFISYLVQNYKQGTLKSSLDDLVAGSSMNRILTALSFNLRSFAWEEDQRKINSQLLLLEVLCWLASDPGLKNNLSSYRWTLQGAAQPLFSGIRGRALSSFLQENQNCDTILLSKLNNLL
ncbi:uncharacterized protein LOC129741368 [Uranotaenia lowii]|uniref:uncharacterized protein LOC129741368 n=1 Tax=Uranotaenia lowii TaxID=190385 RepID=UPI002479E374|nr:uncharacterized protein LOC129741368 [Uranotaenia lowii]